MRTLNTMAHSSSKAPEDLAARGIQYTKEQLEEVLRETEKYVRQNPGQAMLYAFVAGYVLNRLPVGGMMRGLTKLAFVALKPAILVYGAAKLYELAQDNR
jgi:hypothetical protein